MPNTPVVHTPVPEQTEARKIKVGEKTVERVIDMNQVRSIISLTKFLNPSETYSTSGRSWSYYKIILLIIYYQ